MTQGWIEVLAGYLVIGAAILAAMLIHHRLTQPRPSAWAKEVMAAVDPQRRTWRYRLLSNVVAPGLAALFVWAHWPVAMLLAAKWKLDARREKRLEREPSSREDDEETRPAVEPGELLQRLSIDEVERLETVTDPLGAVPPVPFGHLSANWVTFRSKLMPGDEIWSYAAVRPGNWGVEEESKGYAIVRLGLVVRHIVKYRKINRGLPRQI
jgi:hypothetical protein